MQILGDITPDTDGILPTISGLRSGFSSPMAGGTDCVPKKFGPSSPPVLLIAVTSSPPSRKISSLRFFIFGNMLDGS